MKSFIRKIRQRETPFYDWLYKFLKGLIGVSIPSIKWIHLPLYHLHTATVYVVNRFVQGVWIVPLFKARCRKAGYGLKLLNGMPLVLGPLNIYIGDNTTILDSTLASNGQVFENPELIIGSRTTIGYHCDISVALSVKIGDDVMIAKDCFIADNDGHPIDPARRLLHGSVNVNEISPVTIGNNAWIGTGSYILKGTTIGENSIIAANSVVTGDIPANCIAAGTPAKVIKRINDENI